MSILDKLKEQTGKNEATTISDTFPLESGGGGLVVLDFVKSLANATLPLKLEATYDDLYNGINGNKIFYFYLGKTLFILFELKRETNSQSGVTEFVARFLSINSTAEAAGGVKIKTFRHSLSNRFLVEDRS